ncbi:MAG: Gfo/Idh/MocA family oxidoreductase [Lutibacter sp.]|jgi:predicted dehydrogenase|nr:Gfo/Idh/MocA family oxidoreductase [Lutibacter sp.]
MKKRDFLKTSSLALGAAMLPLSFWSCNKGAQVVRTAHIGVGNMGFEDLKAIASHPKVVVTALCDVDQHYLKTAHALFPEAQIFQDYRRMFETMADQIDAVVVSTPDHTHAPASLLAMEHDKAVYCQKPLSHYVSESREMRSVARKKGLVTQMGIQVHSFYDYKLATMLVQGGIIGKVRKVIAWSNKNWGYDGPVPEGADPVPASLDWNLWLGTSQERPYKEGYYHPGNWRKLMDYGCATLGDMGVHIFDTPYAALELDVPNTITNHCRPTNGYGYPERNSVHYTFEGTPYTTADFEWWWFDGEAGPKISDELRLPTGEALPEQGAMFIGEDGRRLLLPHFMQLPKLIVEGAYTDYDIKAYDTEETLGEAIRDYARESPKHYHEFIESCLGNGNCSADFDYAARLTETILLGVIAGRFPGQVLHYDKASSAFTAQEANAFLQGNHRSF